MEALALIVGLFVGFAVFMTAARRAMSKPTGKTAYVFGMLGIHFKQSGPVIQGGGGPGSGELPK